MRRQSRFLRLMVVVVILTVAALLLSTCGSPTATGEPSEALPEVVPTVTAQSQSAITEKRLIVLEWPERILEKDGETITLSLVMDEQGQVTVTPEDASHTTEGTPVEIPNIYDTHNIVAIARLDVAGLETWRDEVREPMRPGIPVTFRWSIRADESGRYRGVLWLWLEFVPKNGAQPERVTVLSKALEIQAVTLLGLSGVMARWLGGAGVVVSSILGFPLIENVLKWLWSRKRQEAQKM